MDLDGSNAEALFSAVFETFVDFAENSLKTNACDQEEDSNCKGSGDIHGTIEVEHNSEGVVRGTCNSDGNFESMHNDTGDDKGPNKSM